MRNQVWIAGLAWVLGSCGETTHSAFAPLRINGSTTVNLVVAEAAEVVREKAGIEILVDTQGGSSGGIAQVGEGRAEIGMSSKPLSDRDRKRFPEVDFVETTIGQDAVALVVSKDVWDGGVRSIAKREMLAIYEGRITYWSEVGGPNTKIAFFNKEPGRGTWEVFATWLYGDADRAAAVSFPEVGGNEETRNKVAGTQGALSQLSASWIDGETVFALSLEEEGELRVPSAEEIRRGLYPMSRPLVLLTDGPPEGFEKTFVDFVLSPRGQAIVEKHGYLSLTDLNK